MRVIDEIVTLELPVLVITTVCAGDDVPVVMLPKLKLVGLALRVKVAAIAEPLRLTEVGEVGALLTMEILPDAVPTDVGVKATVTVVCCPVLTVNGHENPLALKGAPATLI